MPSSTSARAASSALVRQPSAPARRTVLAAGAASLGTLAAAAVGVSATAAPASAEELTEQQQWAVARRAAAQTAQWDEAFMTRAENREGFAVDAMDDWQIENAKLVIAVCKAHDLGEAAAVITLITAIVEAWLYNYEPAVDADSGGMFQQRPSSGWGTYEEVRHKHKAIEAFLGVSEHSENAGLTQLVGDLDAWDPGTAAQAVQGSAFPDRYGEQVAAAQQIWARYAEEVVALAV
ncbi:hypothetical protein ACXET9_15530 [Brachybacterium sp. DNPG3]